MDAVNGDRVAPRIHLLNIDALHNAHLRPHVHGRHVRVAGACEHHHLERRHDQSRRRVQVHTEREERRARAVPRRGGGRRTFARGGARRKEAYSYRRELYYNICTTISKPAKRFALIISS